MRQNAQNATGRSRDGCRSTRLPASRTTGGRIASSRCVPTARRKSNTSVRSISPRNRCRAASVAAAVSSTTSSPTSSATAKPRVPAQAEERPRHRGRSSASTSLSSSATPRANCCNARRKPPLNGAVSTWRATISSTPRSRTASCSTCFVRSMRTPMRFVPRSRRKRTRHSGPMSRLRSPPMPKRHCSPPTTSHVSSARPTSALSTCSWRWLGTRRAGPANSCNALASRIRNFGAR